MKEFVTAIVMFVAVHGAYMENICTAFSGILAICQIHIEWPSEIQDSETLDFTCDA